MFSRFKKILRNNKTEFKPHLLITGSDLKFIKPQTKYLEKYFEIKIEPNNKKRRESGVVEENLKWADIIFCEWLTGTVSWFADNKSKNQKLFIRAHKYELTYANTININFDNVDGVICVNYFVLELFANLYSIPREKMFLLNNFVETSIYSKNKTQNYRKNLAIIGYSPNYKGFMRGLEIFKKLKDYDDEFKLYLMGRDYTEMHFGKQPHQKEYFDKCDEFIEENNLIESIVKRGWVDRNEMFEDIGYVLSVSDIESFHLAPAEGFAANSMGVFINWPSVEYVYPENIIFKSVDEIVNFILDTYQTEEYVNIVNTMNEYCVENFGEKHFVNQLIKIFNTKYSSNKTVFSLYDLKENYMDKIDYVINDSDEIENIVNENKNKRITLLLSENIKAHDIKNIYERYSSPNVLIFSEYFINNFKDAEKFIKMINEIYFRPIKIN